MDAKAFQGDPRLLISRAALLHNAAVIRRAVGPNVRVCGMVKADAYGHGAAIVADALCHFATAPRAGGPAAADAPAGPAVDALAVATIDEASALPAVGVPILVLQPVENAFIGRAKARIEHAVRMGYELTLCSKSAADDVARIAAGVERRASVQVMIDTGMARSGASTHRALELIDRVANWPSLRLAGVCTHFASAEVAGDPFTAEQLASFRTLTAHLAGAVPLHASNSAGTFLVPGAHFDMVRPGISLYGIDPTLIPTMDRPLRPVMKWTAPLVGIREIPRGTSVGYNQTWRAPRDTRIGLVPVGYADGYPRTFANRAVMMVHNRPAPVVGRVSMDLTTIDLGDVPHATIGDDATLLDADPLSPCSAYKLAEWAGTIPYEIFCRIGPRVKRVAVEPEDLEPGRRGDAPRSKTGEAWE
jgi:alanine racemase